MFELFVALKYLIPRRRSLSTALISLLSIFVISLVVWLVLIFLSITTGIEKNWIHKLTSLNAPLRLSPSEEYYRSYYYQVDRFSEQSDFSWKTIGEKAEALSTNPFVESKDSSLPEQVPAPFIKSDGSIVDPVKKAYEILLKKQLAFQDYEISGALLKLTLIRGDANISYLTQMSYLLSLPDKNPNFSTLLLPPSSSDLDHLFHQIGTGRIPKDLSTFFSSLQSVQAKIKPYAPLPLSLFSEGSWKVEALVVDETVKEIQLSDVSKSGFVSAQLYYDKNLGTFFLNRGGSPSIALPPDTFIFLPESPFFDASWDGSQVVLEGHLQEKLVHFPLFFHQVEITSALPSALSSCSLWAVREGKSLSLPSVEGKGISILLPKSLKESGVLIGDHGSLSYASSSIVSSKEQKIPIYVAGFYDTGVLPIGNRFLMVPSSITRTINASSMVFSPDHTPTNGIYVWLDHEENAEKIKADLNQVFQKEGIAPFWKIATYQEYEFSKDLIEQFQSDRTLFTLVALIILIVACSNVISLLVLLVNDKKKEIAILQSMGCRKTSIAIIFGLSGMIMGTISSLLGAIAAIFTLKHLNFFVEILNKMQGHTAFNPAFYGEMLPNEMSYEALLFILVVTPLLALISGLVPAIKAAKLHPSSILRASE
jgi:lipoprotein-releasing system permease protein